MTGSWDKSFVTYDIATKKYTVNIQGKHTDATGLVRNMKDSPALTKKLCTALVRWKDVEEALQTKKEHIAKLQNSMQVKCNL